MDPFADIAVFVKVVETGSFTRAAEALEMSKSHASRRIKHLEDRLGARLIARSTRTLRLTDVGRAFYDRVVPVLEGLQEAEQAVQSLHAEPRGTLRLAAPLSFGLGFLSEPVNAYLARWPEVRVDASFSDRAVDLLAEGFDLAVRGGRMPDSSLVARRLADFDGVVVASPDYLDRHGPPDHPRDLAGHACLDYSGQRSMPAWWFRGPEGEVVAPVQPRFRADNGDVLVGAALAGLGIAYLPEFLVFRPLREGHLVRLLDGWRTWDGSIWAVYPHRRHLSAKVRLFVESLAEGFDTPPWCA